MLEAEGIICFTVRRTRM